MNRLIDLGKLRFHFRGQWEADKLYELNDMVSHGACLYLYTYAVKEAGTEPIHESHWQLIVKGMRHCGRLNAGQKCLIGDAYEDGSSSRVALTNFVSSGNFATDGAAKWGMVALGNAEVPDPIDKPEHLMVVTRNGGYALQAHRDLMRHIKSGETVTAFDGAEFTSDTSKGVARVLLVPNPQGGEKVTLRDSAGSWGAYPLALSGNGKQIEGASSEFSLDEPGVTVVAIYINHELQWRIQA